jgi:hypothetical protein
MDPVGTRNIDSLDFFGKPREIRRQDGRCDDDCLAGDWLFPAQ